MPNTSTNCKQHDTDAGISERKTAPATGRALDGIAYGLAALILALYGARLAPGLGGPIRYWHLPPVLWLAVLSFLFVPPRNGMPAETAGVLSRLRLSALCAAGFSPFVTWWLRCSDHPYLVLGAILAVFAGLWYLVELSLLLRHLAAATGNRKAIRDARAAHMLVLYLILIPVLSLHVSFAVALFAIQGTVPADLERFWFLVPPLFRYATLLPLLNLVRLTWENAGRLWLPAETEKQPLPPETTS